jgi:hypothetical protein
MKFWEVMSAFRESEDVIVSVFNRNEWRNPYYEWFQNYTNLVDTQNRGILDSLVPFELTSEIAKGVTKLYYLDKLSNNLRAAKLGMPEESNIEVMSTLEVHDLFGGAVIEEVKEYGSFVVTNAL